VRWWAWPGTVGGRVLKIEKVLNSIMIFYQPKLGMRRFIVKSKIFFVLAARSKIFLFGSLE
jgi:hypothetical protein